MKPKGIRHLSEIEKNFIRENYSRLTIKEVSKKINRPESTIRKFALKEKLKRKSQNKRELSVRDLAEKLSRTKNTIYAKLRKLNKKI